MTQIPVPPDAGDPPECHSPQPACQFSCKNGGTLVVMTNKRAAVALVERTFPTSAIAHLLAVREGMPASQITPAIKAFKQFMVLALLREGGGLAMVSPIVDAVWHAYLMYPAECRAFDEAVQTETGIPDFHFDHIPATPDQPVDAESIQNFYALLGRHFPRSRAWAKFLPASSMARLN